DSVGRPCVTIEGLDPPVSESHATALALVLHELATNAVKYGALSAEGGRIAIVVKEERQGYRLDWRETGGPPVVEPESGAGFGSGLIRRLAALQLGHEPELHWAATGLEVTIRVTVK